MPKSKALGFVLGSIALTVLGAAVKVAAPFAPLIIWYFHGPLAVVIAAALGELALVVVNPPLAEALGRVWVISLGEMFAWAVLPFAIQHSDILDDPGAATKPSVRWRWLNTLDDPTGEQGMTEPQVKAVFDALGWWWKTYYWLGGRNVCYGLANVFRPRYDFDSLRFTIDGDPARWLCTVHADWKTGSASEYIVALPLGSKRLVMYVGYKLANAYLNALKPLELNPNPQRDASRDVGGVPELTFKLQAPA